MVGGGSEGGWGAATFGSACMDEAGVESACAAAGMSAVTVASEMLVEGSALLGANAAEAAAAAAARARVGVVWGFVRLTLEVGFRG